MDERYENILLERRDGIAKITLNRPEKLNALSQALLDELSAACDAIEADHDIRVVVLTGAGRAFSSGFDIAPGRVQADMPATALWETSERSARTLLRFWYLRQPTIAAVNGYAMAAGNVLAMSCDIVIASSAARFAEPEIRHVAHSPFTLLPFMTHNKHLNWFYLTGDTIDAQTANDWGLITKVVPAEDLGSEAWRAAERIAKVPPYAAQVMKRSIHQVYDKMGFSQSFDHHAVIRMLEGATVDVPEKEALYRIRESAGLRAFLEARDGPFA
jgi:enoyl-CoA hydratase/carnithine racemase